MQRAAAQTAEGKERAPKSVGTQAGHAAVSLLAKERSTTVASSAFIHAGCTRPSADSACGTGWRALVPAGTLDQPYRFALAARVLGRRGQGIARPASFSARGAALLMQVHKQVHKQGKESQKALAFSPCCTRAAFPRPPPPQLCVRAPPVMRTEPPPIMRTDSPVIRTQRPFFRTSFFFEKKRPKF